MVPCALTPSTSFAQRWDNTDSMVAIILSSSASHSATIGGTEEANVAAEEGGTVEVPRSLLLPMLLLLPVAVPVAVPAALNDDDNDVRSPFFTLGSLLLRLLVGVT